MKYQNPVAISLDAAGQDATACYGGNAANGPYEICSSGSTPTDSSAPCSSGAAPAPGDCQGGSSPRPGYCVSGASERDPNGCRTGPAPA